MCESAAAHREETSLAVRAVTLGVVIVPFLGLVAAIVLGWNRGVSAVDLGLLIGVYLVAGFGITLGYHRYFAHRSFETYRPIQALLAICGSIAAQGPVLTWTAIHRSHHQHADGEADPHSPHHHGGGVLGVLAGFWHSHVGWLMTAHNPNIRRYVPDLAADPLLRRIDSFFLLWVALGLLIPAGLGLWLTGGWMGALTGLLWGGLVRMFLGHHVTWSVNSVCHLWGGRPYSSDDESRNNPVFGVLALGEGWHNNHHAFPTSARHGLHWWQIDLTYVLIRMMERVGLVWRVRRPSTASLIARRQAPAAQGEPGTASVPVVATLPVAASSAQPTH